MYPLFLRTLLFLLISQYCRAQFNFERRNDIALQEASTSFKNPWAGGLNCPQFSTIDLNNDGIKDLFVFDRSGNRVLTFLNAGTANTIDYSYHPEYEKSFPDMKYWCLLRDYDGDGKEDIFTGVPGAIKVYKNTSTAIQLSFTLLLDELQAFYDPFSTSIYVGTSDIPSIIDADGDGDLDILTFELGFGGGDAMYFFKNNALEKYGNKDSLDFVLEQTCWGRFKEDANDCTVHLDTCKKSDISYPDRAQRNNLHSGSTILALDATGDGLVDLLIGDISCSTMYLLKNGGTLSDAHMISMDQNFPASKPIRMNTFPAAFYLDVNNDGKKDLLIAPNALNVSENFKNIHLYLNTGTASAPVFTFQGDQFLGNTMLDLGEGCYPAVADLDADGLKDILLGNYGYYTAAGGYPGQLAWLKNKGSLSAPAFELKNRDYSNFSSLHLNGLFPAFGDWNKDGKQDLILGEAQGSINLFYNEGGGSAPALYSPDKGSLKYQNIDIGDFSAPILVDLDKDGNLDLITAQKRSNITYFRNSATGTTPQYSKVTDSLGKIQLDPPSGAINGYQNSWLGDFDGTGNTVLLCTRSDGAIFRFDQIDGNLSGKFLKTGGFQTGMGARISFTVADLDNDGKKDLVVGSYRGGMAIFKQIPGISGITESAQTAFQVYPNPGSDILYVHYPLWNKELPMQLFDLSGRLIKEELLLSPTQSFSVRDIGKGFYLLRIGSGTQKIIIE